MDIAQVSSIVPGEAQGIGGVSFGTGSQDELAGALETGAFLALLVRAAIPPPGMPPELTSSVPRSGQAAAVSSITEQAVGDGVARTGVPGQSAAGLNSVPAPATSAALQPQLESLTRAASLAASMPGQSATGLNSVPAPMTPAAVQSQPGSLTQAPSLLVEGPPETLRSGPSSEPGAAAGTNPKQWAIPGGAPSREENPLGAPPPVGEPVRGAPNPFVVSLQDPLVVSPSNHEPPFSGQVGAATSADTATLPRPASAAASAGVTGEPPGAAGLTVIPPARGTVAPPPFAAPQAAAVGSMPQSISQEHSIPIPGKVPDQNGEVVSNGTSQAAVATASLDAGSGRPATVPPPVSVAARANSTGGARGATGPAAVPLANSTTSPQLFAASQAAAAGSLPQSIFQEQSIPGKVPEQNGEVVSNGTSQAAVATAPLDAGSGRPATVPSLLAHRLVAPWVEPSAANALLGSGESALSTPSSESDESLSQLFTATPQGTAIPGGARAGGARPVNAGDMAETAASVVAQIARQATLHLGQGHSSMQVRLEPEALGRVEVQVLLHDGQVDVRLVTETLHAREAIERGLPQLRTALEQQGLRADHFSVDVQGLRTGLGWSQGEAGRQPAPRPELPWMPHWQVQEAEELQMAGPFRSRPRQTLIDYRV